MTAYELGIRVARHASIPGHLKQAYVRGFAGALEKGAYFDSKEEKQLAYETEKRLNRRKTDTGRNTAIGALLGGLTAAGIGASPIVPKKKPEDAIAAPVALGMLGLVGGAGLGYASAGGQRRAALSDFVNSREATFDELVALAKLRRIQQEAASFAPIGMGGGALGGLVGGAASGALQHGKHPIESLFDKKLLMPEWIAEELQRRK